MKAISLKKLTDFKAIAESFMKDDGGTAHLKALVKSLMQEEQFFAAPENEHYQSVQDHSECVDAILGFQINEIELALKKAAQILHPDGDVRTWGRHMHEGSQSWVGLNPRQLLTPYHELWEMCRLLKPTPGSTLVDLGAGYARMAFVLHQYEPAANFVGYEIVHERVLESQRLFAAFDLSRALMHTQDLSSQNFKIPAADYYLLYDYGNVEHIRQTLKSLQALATTSPMKVIGRGRMRALIDNEHPWLSQVFEPIHRPTFSVYSSF